MARSWTNNVAGLFNGAGKERLEVWRLFLARDHTDIDLAEPRGLQPPVEVAFREAQPPVAIDSPCLFELMTAQVQDDDLTARFQDAITGLKGGLHRENKLQRLGEN